MNSNALDILFIRHAEAESFARDGFDKSERDITAIGEKQLGLLAERFKDAEIDAILSSPLIRTVKTAAAVANAALGNMPIEIIPELIEKETTPGYFGLPIGELKLYYGNLVPCGDRICNLPQTGEEYETKEQCLSRAASVVGYLRNRFATGQKIVVVSHGIFATNFIQAAMGIVNEYDFRFTTDNTAVTKIRFTDDGVRRIAYQNDNSHLLPMSDDNGSRI